MSLIELRERATAAALGTEVMSDTMVEQAKHAFVNLAARFKSESLRADSLATVRIAKQVLLGEGSATEVKEATGGGLDLIFRKLNELRDKIKNEAKEDRVAQYGADAAPERCAVA